VRQKIDVSRSFENCTQGSRNAEWYQISTRRQTLEDNYPRDPYTAKEPIMPTELEEVSEILPDNLPTTDAFQLVEFLHHGNTQIRQVGRSLFRAYHISHPG
jgi:hypothetical protein